MTAKPTPLPGWSYANTMRRVSKARNFPTNTDPCSRHAVGIAADIKRRGLEIEFVRDSIEIFFDDSSGNQEVIRVGAIQENQIGTQAERVFSAVKTGSAKVTVALQTPA